jgi:hypothetical protein
LPRFATISFEDFAIRQATAVRYETRINSDYKDFGMKMKLG